MKYGIIDIGSNTIRLVVYKVNGSRFECIFNEKYFVQLIGYIKNGVMSDEGIKAMIRTLLQLKEITAHYDLENLYCFATAPLRAVEHAGFLVKTIKEFTGLTVDVLSGEEEASLGVLGAQCRSGAQEGLFVDLGGGSMEISLMKEGQTKHAASIPLGCVDISNRFVSEILPGKKEMKKINKFIDKSLEEIKWLTEARDLNMYCIGGTSRALGLVHKVFYGSESSLESYSFHAKDIRNIYKSIVEMKTEGIRLMTKFCPGRIFTFVPGIMTLARLAKHSGVDKICFSTYGVREGYLIHNVLSKQNTDEAQQEKAILPSAV